MLMEENFEYILQQVYTEVKARFLQLNDLAHGWEHVNRVYTLARHIAVQEKADQFIVSLAALMHDLGRTVHEESEHAAAFHHADASVEMATEILVRYEVPVNIREAVLHAIIAHSFSRSVTPTTLEAHVVRDADRLDGLGAIGIMRWAMVGEQKRTPQTQGYHPEDPLAEQHVPDDQAYILDHFYAKLLKLTEGIVTATGKRIGESRTAFMRTYLEEFKRELDIEQ
jgi:uncharacterized protein